MQGSCFTPGAVPGRSMALEHTTIFSWADGTDGCPADSYPASGWIVTSSARYIETGFRAPARTGMGRPFNPHAERSRARPSSTLGELIRFFKPNYAAIGELESPPRCQRGDRGFESRWWRPSEQHNPQGRAWRATRGFDPRHESSNLSAPFIAPEIVLRRCGLVTGCHPSKVKTRV